MQIVAKVVNPSATLNKNCDVDLISTLACQNINTLAVNIMLSVTHRQYTGILHEMAGNPDFNVFNGTKGTIAAYCRQYMSMSA